MNSRDLEIDIPTVTTTCFNHFGLLGAEFTTEQRWHVKSLKQNLTKVQLIFQPLFLCLVVFVRRFIVSVVFKNHSTHQFTVRYLYIILLSQYNRNTYYYRELRGMVLLIVYSFCCIDGVKWIRGINQ